MTVELNQAGTIRIKPESDLEAFALSQFNEIWKNERHAGIIIYGQLEEQEKTID